SIMHCKWGKITGGRKRNGLLEAGWVRGEPGSDTVLRTQEQGRSSLSACEAVFGGSSHRGEDTPGKPAHTGASRTNQQARRQRNMVYSSFACLEQGPALLNFYQSGIPSKAARSRILIRR